MNNQIKNEKQKYWLKIEKDFLKSSQIKVIKNMPNGLDYIVFYLAIMLEGTNTAGHLRFSDLVPYNEIMLASVTDTNVDIVRSAVKLFVELGMLEILEDGTYFLPDVARRVGKESDSAERVRLYRKRQALLQSNASVTKSNSEVTECNDNKEKEKEKNKEKNKERDKDADFSLSQKKFNNAFSNKEINCDIPDEVDVDLIIQKIHESNWLKQLTQPLSWFIKNYNEIILDKYKTIKSTNPRVGKNDIQGHNLGNEELQSLFTNIEEVEI